MKKLIKVLFTLMIVFIVSGCDDLGSKEDFNITFFSNEGSEVASIVVEEGSTFLEPTNPTRVGYDFSGWYSDSTFNFAYDFSQAVIGDLNLYAEWTEEEFTISFVTNQGSLVEQIKYLDGDILTELEESTREGFTFDGWFYDDDLYGEFDSTTPATGDFTLYAKWIINQYTVSFESNGGTSVDSITQDYGTMVNQPIVPTNGDHGFLGWFTEEELINEYNFYSNLEQDDVLYAKWGETVLHIMFVPNRPADEILTITEPLKELLKAELALLGYDFDVINITVGSSFEEVGLALVAGQAHVAFLPASIYVSYAGDGLIDLALVAARDALSITSFDPIDWNTGVPTENDSENMTPYYTGLIVAGPSTYGQYLSDKINNGEVLTWEDVSNATWCVRSITSSSGYIYPNLWLQDNYGKSFDDIPNVLESFGYGNSIELLALETCDIATVFSDARMYYESSWTDAGQTGSIWEGINVIGITEPIMNDVIATSTLAIDEGLKAAIQQAFINIIATTEGQQIMDIYSHHAYMIVEDEMFDGTRRLYD